MQPHATPTKICSRCHEPKVLSDFTKSKRETDGLDRFCRPCKKILFRETYERHREFYLERRKSYYREFEQPDPQYLARQSAAACQWAKDNPAKTNAKSKRHRERYHERELVKEAAYREANRELTRERSRRWRRTHPEDNSARHAKYRSEHPQRFTEYAANRRAHKLNAPEVERIDRSAIIARDKSICHICGKVVIASQMSLDHLVPLSKGGRHTADNLAVAHRRCNSLRSAGTLPAQLRMLR